MYLADKSAKVLCAQHDADEDIPVTHCHVMIVTPEVTDQAIAKARMKYDIKGSGNSLMKVTEKTRDPYDEKKLATYICKGNIDNVKLYTSYTHHNLVDYVKTWIPREKWIEEQKKAEKTQDKDKTHWTLIERVWTQLESVPALWEEVLEFNNSGSMKTLNCKGRDAAFDSLVLELNKCKVRTSRNELERFYVTLLRFDRVQVKCMKRSILENVFR